jgi:hypothetical protein
LQEVGRLDRDDAPRTVREQMKADGKRAILSMTDGDGQNYTVTVYADDSYGVRRMPL